MTVWEGHPLFLTLAELQGSHAGVLLKFRLKATSLIDHRESMRTTFMVSI